MSGFRPVRERAAPITGARPMRAAITPEGLMDRLAWPPFSEVVRHCRNDESPGCADPPEAQSWVSHRSTDDQLRIEQYLESLVSPSLTVLHVGIGNSSLAKRFAPRVGSILGLTIQQDERAFAEAAGIANYRAFVGNKYSLRPDRFDEKFDIIVDNNPSTYACCLYHFARMMVAYRELLCDTGIILTDVKGLGWVAVNTDPRWSLYWSDWEFLGEALGMATIKLTKFVYGMKYPHPPLPGPVPRSGT